MPTDSRAQSVSVSDIAGATSRDRNGMCAAGAAHTFAYSFRIDRPGHFVTYRGSVNVGGIMFKPGGWIAYERQANGRMAWTPNGRIKASSAAFDLWGRFAADQVKLCPENRPPDPPSDDGARLRREIITQEVSHHAP